MRKKASEKKFLPVAIIMFFCLLDYSANIAFCKKEQAKPQNRSKSVTKSVTFKGLGDLPGGGFHSQAYAVTADGSIVVGLSRSSLGTEAFRWTSPGGMVGLGGLLGGRSGRLYAGARAISANGSAVVGYDGSKSKRTFCWEAFRWTTAGGMQGLGDLRGGKIYSRAYDVSSDGQVVVGASSSGNSATEFEAFCWTAKDGMVGLGDLPGGPFNSYGQGVSADSSTVVGSSNSNSGPEAFRWTSNSGMVGLGDLPGGNFCSRAFAVSADGSVVVGYSESVLGKEAFRWTKTEGMQSLGDLPGGDVDGCAWAVSGDGAIIVGSSKSALGMEAFIWDANNGIRSLKLALEKDYGLELTGWTLRIARGISDDGLTIVGWGTNGNRKETPNRSSRSKSIYRPKRTPVSVQTNLPKTTKGNKPKRAIPDGSTKSRKNKIDSGSNGILASGNIEGWIVTLPQIGDDVIEKTTNNSQGGDISLKQKAVSSQIQGQKNR